MCRNETIRKAFWQIGISDVPGTGHPHFLMAEALYRDALLAVLMDGRWSFAIRQEVLPVARCAVLPHRGEFVAVLPGGCVKLLACDAVRFSLQGGAIFLRGSRKFARVAFTSLDLFDANLDDGVAPYDPVVPEYFLECLKLRLAALLCMPMLGNAELEERMLGLYTVLRRKVLTEDVRQYGSNDQLIDPVERAMGGGSRHPFFD